MVSRLRRRTLRTAPIEEEYTPIDWRAASRLLDLSFGRVLAEQLA
jgi:hypothetical protein